MKRISFYRTAIRIESDKDITTLLKRHKKYGEEYMLNIEEQGYIHLVIRKFAGVVIACAIGGEVIRIMNEELNKENSI